MDQPVSDDRLEALTAAVRLTRAALDTGDVAGPPVTFDPPALPDGALDPRQRHGATALLAELEDLVERLAAAQQRVADELAASRRPRPGRSPVPSAQYLDSYG